MTTTAAEPATRHLPVDIDELTVAEFLDLVRWWAALPSAEKQAVLGQATPPRKRTLH